MLKSLLAAVLLYALVKIFFVSRMQDFSFCNFCFLFKLFLLMEFVANIILTATNVIFNILGYGTL